MKYYFYDSEGNVDLIWHKQPPIELGDKYIASEQIFKEKEGYILKLKIIGDVLTPEYIEKPKDKYDLLLEENEATKQALAELTMFISTMNGGM